MTKQLSTKDELTEFLLYTAPDVKIKVEIFLHNENFWLTQKRMAELFGVQIPAISKHLKNIFESGELEENSVISILKTTAEEEWLLKVTNGDVQDRMELSMNSTLTVF